MPALRTRGYVEDMVAKFGIEPGARVLDTAAGWEPNWYESLFPGCIYVKQDMQDFDPPCIDIVCDGCEIEKAVPPGSFDVVLNLDALDRMYDPFKAVQGFRSVLREDGILIVTTTMFYPYRPPGPDKYEMKDYWRFTPSGVVQLLKDFFILDLTVEGTIETARSLWVTARKPKDHERDQVHARNLAYDIPVPVRSVAFDFVGEAASTKLKAALADGRVKAKESNGKLLLDKTELRRFLFQ